MENGDGGGQPTRTAARTDATLARRAYVRASLLQWLPTGLIFPVYVPLVLSAGLTVPAVGLLFAVHAAVALAAEVPAGALADRVGPGRALAGSLVGQAAGLFTLLAVDTVAGFAAVTVVNATARALGSGVGEAWYVEQVRRCGGDPGARTGLAAGAAATAVAIAAGSVLGGVLPLAAGRWLPAEAALQVPAWVGGVVALAAAAALPRLLGPAGAAPPGHRSGAAVVATMAAAVRASARGPAITRLAGVAAGLGLTATLLETVWPAALTAVAQDPSRAAASYAAVLAAGFLVQAGAARSAPVAHRAAGDGRRAGAGALLLSAGALAALAVADRVEVALVLVLLVQAGTAVSGPLRASLLHAHAEPAHRVTMVSVQAFVGQLGMVAGGLMVATVPGAARWLSAAAVVAGCAAVLLRADRDRDRNGAA